MVSGNRALAHNAVEHCVDIGCSLFHFVPPSVGERGQTKRSGGEGLRRAIAYHIRFPEYDSLSLSSRS